SNSSSARARARSNRSDRCAAHAATARSTSLPTFANCSASVSVFQRPVASAACPVMSALPLHQRGDDLPNATLQYGIFDISRPVPLRGTDVDHRIELAPRLFLLGSIQINA